MNRKEQPEGRIRQSDPTGRLARHPHSTERAYVGDSAALPEGSLSKPYLGPQGDENRDPPRNAPGPIPSTRTVKDTDLRRRKIRP
jgi:hypothetical protein